MNEDPPLDAREVWRVLIDAPIEVVWNTIVATDEVLPHLFGAVCEAPDGLENGRAFRMVSRNGRMVSVVGEVLDFSPPHRFSHSIHFTRNEGEVPGRTTYELKEVGTGTELTLISEAVAGSKTAKMARSGPFIVKNLKRIAETGRPAFSGAFVSGLAPLVAHLAPRIARAENWPVGRTRA